MIDGAGGIEGEEDQDEKILGKRKRSYDEDDEQEEE